MTWSHVGLYLGIWLWQIAKTEEIVVKNVVEHKYFPWGKGKIVPKCHVNVSLLNYSNWNRSKCSDDWFHELKCTKRIGEKWRKWCRNVEQLPCCIPVLTVLGYSDSINPFHKPQGCGLGEVPWPLPVPTNQVKDSYSSVLDVWVGLD